MTNQVGTVIYAPIVPGENVMDDIPSAFGDQLGRTIHKFDTDADRDSFSLAYKSRLYKSWCVVKPGLWYEWDGTQVDGSDGQWVQINIGDAARITFENIGGNYDTFIASTLSVAPPLRVESSKSSPGQIDPDRVVMAIDERAFERQHAAGYLAYLNDEVNVIGKVWSQNPKHKGALWFDDTVVNALPYIQLDRDNKLIGIQEYDNLDPNLTGGQDYIVAFRINMKGNAPNDGYVRAYLNEFDQLGQFVGVMTDVNGQPLSFERNYKAGDKLGYITVVGIVKATAIRYFACNVEDTFQDEYITITDPTEGISGVMVQAITGGEKTGPALLQFEADTGHNISFSSHHLGYGIMDMVWLISTNDAPIVIAADVGITMPDGYGIYNLTPIKAGKMGSHLHIEDNGSDIADFNLHRIFSAEETQMLRGKQVDVSVVLTDKDMAFKVAMMKWIGKPDEYTKTIYTSRNNNVITPDTGWIVAGELFISEDAVTGDHTHTKRFTVPSDANNIAFMIYPEAAQQPMLLQIKNFHADVVTPFTGYVIHYPELDSEKHLQYSEQFKSLYQDNQGYSALRYTINAADIPAPIGMIGEGAADVALNTAINTIAGSNARGGEGGIEFKSDGNVTVTSYVRLWSEKAVGSTSTVEFWYELVDSGQQRGTKIDASSGEFIVHGGSKGSQFYMPVFSTDVLAGQTLILRMKGDGPDCAFLQSTSPSAPMLYTQLKFNEAVSGSSDDPFSGIDMSQFTKVYYSGMTVTKDVANVASVVIPIDIPDDVNLVVLGAIKELADLTVRPVAKLDWSYSNTQKRLTVSFGETVLVGRVTMGLYL